MKMRKLLTGVVAAAMAVSTFAFAAVAEDTAAPTVYTYKPTKEATPSYVYHVTETINFGAIKFKMANTASTVKTKAVPTTGFTDGTTAKPGAFSKFKINGIKVAGDGMPTATTSLLTAGIQGKDGTGVDGLISAGIYNSLTITYDVILTENDYLYEDLTKLTTSTPTEIDVANYAKADDAADTNIAGPVTLAVSSRKVEVENTFIPDASNVSAFAETYTNVDGGNMFSFKIAEVDSMKANGATLTFNLAEAAKNEGFVNLSTNLNRTKMGVWFDKGSTTTTVNVPASYLVKELGSEYQQNLITFSWLDTNTMNAIKVASIDLAIAPLAISDDIGDDVAGSEAIGDDADLAEDEEETIADEEETVADEEETVADEEETAAPTDDKNQPTGVALAIVPVAIAGAAAIVAKKRK